MNRLIKKYNKADSKHKEAEINFHRVYTTNNERHFLGIKNSVTDKDVNRANKKVNKAGYKVDKLGQALRNYQTSLEGKFKVAKENYDKAQTEYLNSSIRGPKLAHNLMKADNKLTKIRKEIKATRAALNRDTYFED